MAASTVEELLLHSLMLAACDYPWEVGRSASGSRRESLRELHRVTRQDILAFNRLRLRQAGINEARSPWVLPHRWNILSWLEYSTHCAGHVAVLRHLRTDLRPAAQASGVTPLGNTDRPEAVTQKGLRPAPDKPNTLAAGCVRRGSGEHATCKPDIGLKWHVRPPRSTEFPQGQSAYVDPLQSMIHRRYG